MPQAYHAEWLPAEQMPGFTPRYHLGWDHTPQPHEAKASRWREADDTEWTKQAHSSDSKGLPPPVQPQQPISDHRGWEEINTQLGGLEICTGEISTQWQLKQQQLMAQVNALLKQQHNQHMAYWQSMGYNLEP